MDSLACYASIDRILGFEESNNILINLINLFNFCTQDPDYEPSNN
jgi:hypothetical protein